MTVKGLISFNRKGLNPREKIRKSSDEIVWNGGYLKIDDQNRVNYKYHLLVKADEDLQELSNPSSINSNDWEGFFMSDKVESLNNHPEGIVVTYSLDENICTITRDTFGLIPIYYFYSPDNFLAFSTSLPSLLQMEGVLDHLSINTKRIIQYLTFRADSLVDYQAETFFEQINSILPGHQLTVTSNVVRTKSSVDFNPSQWNHLSTLPEFAEVFRKLFTDSVAKSANKGILGSHLSGGMDSSSISSVAKELFPEKELHTFHAAPNTKFASESEYAKAVADKIGSIHQEVTPQDNDLELLIRYTAIYGHPEVMILSPALQGSLLEAANANGCTTLLIGHDGDSIVGSGFDYLTELFNKRNWAELKDFLIPRTQNPVFKRLFKNWNKLSEAEKLRAVYHDFFGRRFSEVAAKSTIKELFALYTDIKRNFNISTLHFLRRGLNVVFRKFIDKSIPNSIVRKSVRILAADKSDVGKTLSESLSENLEKKYTYSFSSVYNAQSITMNEEFFALGNHYNIKTPLPFYDKGLFELCMSVPSKLKLGDGIGRQHFGEAMKGLLPESVRMRRDKAVFGSYARLAAIRLFRDAEELINNDTNHVWDFVDQKEFRKIVHILHDDNQKPLTYGICQFHILRTISLAVWFDWLDSLKYTSDKKRL